MRKLKRIITFARACSVCNSHALNHGANSVYGALAPTDLIDGERPPKIT
jgi:hypothetical protein